jgi:hypothetical protein
MEGRGTKGPSQPAQPAQAEAVGCACLWAMDRYTEVGVGDWMCLPSPAKPAIAQQNVGGKDWCRGEKE